NYYLQAYYLWIKPEEVHGFVINPRYMEEHCNIVANAEVHTGKKHVLNIDLKDFFPSISARRIKALFSSPYFNYNEQIATALTLLTTYQAKLPTGAPTSPVLSNFVCLELDADLRSFCQENQLQFTRYADDLTFSSNTLIPQDTIQNIKQIIQKHGFEINEKKLRLQSSFRKQTVTGLTVNEKVNVDRKLLKKIRAMLHDLTTNGIEAATRRHFNLKEAATTKQRGIFIYRLEGYINFVGQVRGKYDTVYLKLMEPFEAFFTPCPSVSLC
ncbi:MAG: reverse transcriptase family protein, partial [Bacteroidales bacterium]|nr:reverse transcriptase family protein [Bacteroidales bacterium]